MELQQDIAQAKAQAIAQAKAQAIAQARVQAIEALEASMRASKNLMEIELQIALQKELQQKELQQDIAEEIEAIEDCMRIRKRRFDSHTKAGLMSERICKEYNDLYHKCRIQLLVLKGEIPAPIEKKKKPRSFSAYICAAV